MLILLTGFPHFELTFSSEPIITLKPSSCELQEINMNVALLLSRVSPETDPGRRVCVQVVCAREGIPGSTNRRAGERGGQQYAGVMVMDALLCRLPSWDAVPLETLRHSGELAS